MVLFQKPVLFNLDLNYEDMIVRIVELGFMIKID